MMTRQLKTPEGEAPAPATDWVNEMKSYFQETGTYRAEDVQRVLGKPGESFEGKPTPDTQHHAGSNQASAKSETSTTAGHQKIGSGGGNDGGSDYPDIHPAILGLLRDLPKAGSPLSDKRRKSLIAAFTSAVDFIYPEPDEVNA